MWYFSEEIAKCTLYYLSNMLKNQRELGYGQTLKVTMENVAEKEEVKEEQQQDDDEWCDTVPNLKLVYEGMCVK